MPSLPRVSCPRNTWTIVSGGMTVGVSYSLQTNENVPFVLCEKDAEPNNADSRLIVDTKRHYVMPFRYSGVNLWARPTEIDNNLVIVEIHDTGGLGQPIMPIDSEGNLETIRQDQHSEVIDLLLHQVIDTITLLANYSIGTTFIAVETTGAVPVIGDYICLKEDTAFYQAEVLTVTPIAGNQYTLKMDSPLDYPYTTAGGCSLDDVNLAVDGSSIPVTFEVSPVNLVAGTEWDVTRMSMIMVGEGPVQDPAPDDTNFGTQAALTNGVVFRSVNGITKNIFNAKTNGIIKLRCGGDLHYQVANKNGLYSVDARRTFNGDEKNGITIRLEANTADQFQCIVQDDLTDLEVFMVNIQGHVVDK